MFCICVLAVREGSIYCWLCVVYSTGVQTVSRDWVIATLSASPVIYSQQTQYTELGRQGYGVGVAQDSEGLKKGSEDEYMKVLKKFCWW